MINTEAPRQSPAHGKFAPALNLQGPRDEMFESADGTTRPAKSHGATRWTVVNAIFTNYEPRSGVARAPSSFVHALDWAQKSAL